MLIEDFKAQNKGSVLTEIRSEAQREDTRERVEGREESINEWIVEGRMPSFINL